MKKVDFKKIVKSFKSEGYIILSKPSEYKNNQSKIRFICNKKHQHQIDWAHWNNGQKCKKCKHNAPVDFKLIKKSFKKEGYVLLDEVYINAKYKMSYICPSGHKHSVSWDNWDRRKSRCPTCAGNAKIKYKKIMESMKEEGYILLTSKKDYKNSKSKLEYICSKGHKHVTTWNYWNSKSRCPSCSKSISKQEIELKEYLHSLNLYLKYNVRSIIFPQELDIYLPSKKIAIEYCGLYWHSENNGKDKFYHLNKLEKCLNKDLQLLTLFEDEWVNKREIVKQRLKHILGFNKKKIYARNCYITEINTKTARCFIEKIHIQGYTSCRIKIGAYYNYELVAVMTFSKPSLSKGRKDQQSNIWELSRFCTSKTVVGIASRLLKYFQRNFEWEEIFSFADRRWSIGNVYEKIGFEKIGYTKPNYWYFKRNNTDGTRRYHRFNFRRDKLEGKGTEWEIMQRNGWDRIWDCGNIKYNIINHRFF